MPKSDVTTVLVVGCGYIGLPFARLAKGAGYQVYATTRKRERFAELEAEGLIPVLWDVTGGDIEGLIEQIKQMADFKGTSEERENFEATIRVPEVNHKLPLADAVIWTVGHDRSARKSIDEVYVSGLLTTLISLRGSPKFVYASSTGVYGDADGDWIHELTPPNPSDETSEACLRAEQFLGIECEIFEWSFCILRFAGIYGPGRLIGGEALKRGEPIAGDGAAWLNLVHQQDAALALWKAMHSGGAGEIYNIADGHPVPRQEFYLKLAELLGTPPPKFAPELARRQRGNRRIYAGKAREKLGWTPRLPSYVEGLEAIVTQMNGERGA